MSSSDDDSSDSGEDVPLSMLGKSPHPPVDDSDENEFDDENDDGDDESSYSDDESDDQRGGADASESDDDSSDDDVPLSALKSTKAAASPAKKKKAASSSSSKKEKKTPAKKEKTPAKKAKTTKTKKATPKKKSPSNGMSKSKSASSGDMITASSELYSKSEKGRLINALLCRWWYAITWPNPKTTPPAPPAGYDALDGFPGVFVCTEGDKVGQIQDTRDHSTCPNFRNFARKDASELRELLITAIDKQKEQLVEHEGEGTDTEKELDKLRKWAKKLNTDKADREAAKVLKAARLTL